MGVRARIRRWALRRPRVLVIDTPGSQGLRWQLEAELDRRLWPPALSPADADLVLVLGRPGPELAAATEVLWSQVPQPRHRQDIGVGGDLQAQLDAALRALAEHDEHDMHQGGDVDGLPMADTAPDRDGLRLDVLRVTLGPVLPAWPTGLLLRGSLQGDVLTGVDLSWVDTDLAVVEDAVAAGPEALALDRLARFLLVAGWPTAAAAARRARTGLSDPDSPRVGQARRDAARVVRRIRRSRSLRWSVRGIGPAAPVGGDVWDHVHRWCEIAAGADCAPSPVAPRSLTDLATELEGSELAAARLILASSDLERPTTRVSAEPADV